MPKLPSIAAIILAAGRSSRMQDGQQKLLLQLGDQPIITHVVEAALASHVTIVIVILGYRATEIRACLQSYQTDARFHVLENNNYAEGMSSSLKQGIQTLLDYNNESDNSTPRFDGAMIVLGDQPLITTDIINTLIAEKQRSQSWILRAAYNGKGGNPVLFDAHLLHDLLEVTGDEGGRRIIERNKEHLKIIEMGDPTANYDVDTRDTYEQVVTIWKRQH